MTVKELTAKLSAFPDDTLVLVKGYEEAYNDIDKILEMKVHLNVHEHWYYGAHDETKEPDGIAAIALVGENKNAGDW